MATEYTVSAYASGGLQTLTITFTAMDANTDDLITPDELEPGSTFTIAWVNASTGVPTFTVSDVIEAYTTFDFTYDILAGVFDPYWYVEFFDLEAPIGLWDLEFSGIGDSPCTVDAPCLITIFDDATTRYSMTYGESPSFDNTGTASLTQESHLIPYGGAVGAHGARALFNLLEGRHYHDQIALTFFRREPVYGESPVWDATTACALRDFSNASPHEVWDDLVVDNEATVHETEYVTVQRIVRQSVRVPYEEARLKPNTLAGIWAYGMGTITTTQNGTVTAYRHTITPAASGLLLPSMTAEIRHQYASHYRYLGLKVDQWRLASRPPFLALEAPLIGSGHRAESGSIFPAQIDEPWLLWGDCRLYLRNTGGTPITVPSTPSQSATNISGGGVVEVSSWVLRAEIESPNRLWAAGGYRPRTGKIRGSLHAPKRQTTVTLELQINRTTEYDTLNYYLTQAPMALEWQCTSTTLIAPTGTFFYGAITLIPRLQFREIPRDETGEFDTLTLVGTVMDDRTNPTMIGWVYNAQPAYAA